ncbi:MAG: hypothetical protein OEV22_03685 [Deltaproteobacteria bacterium]|nr:hypothetical protein [Deltaproteobacteria bacterium]
MQVGIFFKALLRSPDISWITCCDQGYGRPSWRPRVSAPATYRSEVRLGTNTLWLPGGTPILFALAALRSVPHRKRHLRQAGSQLRGLATAIAAPCSKLQGIFEM